MLALRLQGGERGREGRMVVAGLGLERTHRRHECRAQAAGLRRGVQNKLCDLVISHRDPFPVTRFFGALGGF